MEYTANADSGKVVFVDGVKAHSGHKYVDGVQISYYDRKGALLSLPIISVADLLKIARAVKG